MGRILLLILILLILCLGVAVGYYNAQVVTFNYLVGAREMPLIGLILLVMAAAMLLTLLVCASRILALKNDNRRLRKKLRDADAELKNLRNLPLKDTP